MDYAEVTRPAQTFRTGDMSEARRPKGPAFRKLAPLRQFSKPGPFGLRASLGGAKSLRRTRA